MSDRTICDECSKEYPADQAIDCKDCGLSMCPECYEEHCCEGGAE